VQVAGDYEPLAEAARTFKVTKGTEVMHKVMFAAALAVGLITAPMPQLVSTAAAQQQATTPDKNAKPKKDPSAGQTAARDRQKKCGAEWKEAKAAGKVEKGTTWPKYWSACNKRLKAASK
jgi:hypothetical protein